MNVLAVAVFGILGFGHPAFWLLGLGLETAFLAGLSTNPRFHRLVDAEQQARGADDDEAKRRSLVAQLGPAERPRLTAIQAKCDRAVELSRRQEVEEYVLEGNRTALAKLSWLYLRLLLAGQYLRSAESQTTEAKLREQIARLQRELAAAKVAPSLRESKSATLKILERRLENLERREQTLAEIDSDLMRIEAQVDLAVENATMSGQPQAVSSNIGLVSQMLEPELFGASERTIADLDQTYGPPAAARERA